MGKNTDLKGGIISSEATAEKNKLSTGTLTFEDIENKADYKSSSAGANANIKNGAGYNEQGVTPAIGMPASGKEESKTKATISEGTIEIRDKESQKQDVNKLNRDTNNSLNKLGEIFDKNTVKEKQEFAGLFQEFAHNYIGELTGKVSKDEKAILNSFVDGLISQWTNGNFIAGAGGTALLESMQKEIDKIKDPALKQIAAGMIGAIAGKIVGDNAQAGASSAISTEKYNWLAHEEQEKLVNELSVAKNNVERLEVITKWFEISKEHKDEYPKIYEAIEQILVDELIKLKKFDNAGISFEVEFDADAGLHSNLDKARNFLSFSGVLGKYLQPNTVCDFVQMSAEDIVQKVYAMGDAKIQVIDTTVNIARNYDGNMFTKEFGKMIANEVAKGTVIYGVHTTLKKNAVPDSLIMIGDIIIIIASNLK